MCYGESAHCERMASKLVNMIKHNSDKKTKKNTAMLKNKYLISIVKAVVQV